MRHAKRLADRLRAAWTAIHVETSRTQRLSDQDRDKIADCLRLAQRLGGEAVTVPGTDVATDVLEYAQSNNVTHIVIAKSRRPRWSEWLRGSLTHRLIRQAGDISVHVIAEPKHQPPQHEEIETTAPQRAVLDIRNCAGSLGIVAVAVGVGLVLQRFLAVSDIAMVFLTAVLVSAVAYGLWPSLFTCLVSVLAYNFFFLPPLYTFTIAEPENVVALFFFALVALIASNLASRMRSQAIAARQRARTTEELYLFSRKLASAASLDDLLWATTYQIASMLKVRVVVLLPEGETIAVRAGYPPEDRLDQADLAAATWCWGHNHPAGRGADTLPGAKRLFLPMRTSRSTVGVVGLDSDRSGPLLTPDQRRLLDALSDQAALAIERISLAHDVTRARFEAETERLRSALLTSISHDLRTPLASILGSATSLRNYRKSLDDTALEELIGTIQEESERLNRFISNLLDMTRLEAGAITLHTELVDVGDVVGTALERAKRFLAAHTVKLELASPLPLLRLDPVLFEQVLFNLLDNAAKYAPPGSTIGVTAHSDADAVRLQVVDEGAGIPPPDLDRIFDKFYRIHAADRQRAGTGLGLAICRGFIEAMGGSIIASNRQDRQGAAFAITLPVPAAVMPPRQTAA